MLLAAAIVPEPAGREEGLADQRPGRQAGMTRMPRLDRRNAR